MTSGTWSPTRAGVFFVTRNDGALDAWDLFYRQTSPAYTHKVSDAPLSAVALQGASLERGGGRLLAVGDASGTITMLELSENLVTPQSSEKNSIGLMFERESKREETLEKRALALARAARSMKTAATGSPGGSNSANEAGEDSPEVDLVDPEVEEALKAVSASFTSLIGEQKAAEPEGAAPAVALSVSNVEAKEAEAEGAPAAAEDTEEGKAAESSM